MLTGTTLFLFFFSISEKAVFCKYSSVSNFSNFYPQFLAQCYSSKIIILPRISKICLIDKKKEFQTKAENYGISLKISLILSVCLFSFQRSTKKTSECCSSNTKRSKTRQHNQLCSQNGEESSFHHDNILLCVLCWVSNCIMDSFQRNCFT